MWKIDEFFSLEGCPCPEAFAEVQYPWELLPRIEELIYAVVEKNPGKYRQIADKVWVGEGTAIADTAVLYGPAVFGENCRIRPNAFVRENVLAGDGIVIGNASEAKQVILFSEVQLAHFNYAGDSILGRGAHLGAGAIISNFKTTKDNVKVKVGEEVIETGLRKFGAILGDWAEVGCNAVLNPGTLVGRGSIIYPLTSVRGSVPAQTICKAPGVLIPRQPN
ncbi:MAG: UDP-N-acetylglucosamine pyrophosphorylase [Bacillota bacterium]|nr:UDP-N-acetylglucosamine pyrophosphorylase [Bacillota bacterium]NLJ01987.1 UDP-N-acetylglucosamine pyrophosphorylase [Bacillota bacterium]